MAFGGVLGVIVILTAGTFGTINSSPWFNLGIAVIFVVLSFAMFDVLQIDLSRFRARWQRRLETRQRRSPARHGRGGRARGCLRSVVIPTCERHTAQASCSASAWRYPGRRRAPVCHPALVRGWFA